MTLIKDLIDIPERVHRGDFVLKLTEGVARPGETLRTYVVTPQLGRCFDEALAFIRSALETRSSKAAYLHGSFGSGKSHFMAVLHLLLQGEPAARAIPELAPVVARHNAWTEGKRFLLVPYHMIAARSMESAILGHYAEHVQRIYPRCPIPGIYLAERIFEDARRLREQMGDERFFGALNGSGQDPEGWGRVAARWDAGRFEGAMAALAGDQGRIDLVGDLVSRFFSAYQGVARSREEAFVTLDEGLSIISRHAQSLGYDALVLFLDELILWLASHAADIGFVNREGQKLAKLVEAERADRPIPIVSFVARQRDLRELVGEHVTGAEQLAFGDVLKWWEARFHTITLEDRNLPAIAEKRLLKPKSDTARQQIDQAFSETGKVRDEVLETLLTSTGDRAMFRQVYPFSPALVQALIAVSSVLQRERTALKVMLGLLVDQRDTLELGQIVPVGDLFDVIAGGNEAFSEGMRQHFENAKRLYHQKLLPLLERHHRLRVEELPGLPRDDPRAAVLRADDRLVKALLLAALVPEVEALKNLTPTRLAALNHGTIRSPIPGREGQEVLRRCRAWAAEVGEIKIGEELTNPTISVQLTGVDTATTLEKARGEDNTGNRRRKVREILFSQLGVTDRDELWIRHEFVWRGTRRECELLYANVRELPDESLRARGEGWKVIIDFPFDEPGYSPRDDLARIQDFRGRQPPSNTLLWVPSFLSPAAQADLGKLVILEHVLTGERFDQYASHLSAVDRNQARALLDNQRSQLRQRLINILEGAYGVTVPIPGTVDQSHELAEHFQALDPTFHPRPPAAPNLGEAFKQVLYAAPAHQFPGHPEFEAEVKPTNLRKVWIEVERAAQTKDGRIAVEPPLRPILRQIAGPLGLGEMHETHFVASYSWRDHFLRKAAQERGSYSVGKLRAWMDDPQPRGLPVDVQNLVILYFAAQEDLSFFLHGGAVSGSLDSLPDELELRPVVLPPEETWMEARRRAASILGVTVSELRSAANVTALSGEVRSQVETVREHCRQLCGRLSERYEQFGVASDSARMRTAHAVLALVEAVAAIESKDVVPALARARIATSAEAMGTSLKKAGTVCQALASSEWEVFDALAPPEALPEVGALRERIRSVLANDEYAVALGPALSEAYREALGIMRKSQETEQARDKEDEQQRQVTVIARERKKGLRPEEAGRVLEEVERTMAREPDALLDMFWEIYKRSGK